MKIKKINLKKYKRFHDLTIDLGDTPKRIVALIGPNGCGKSSIFDGISFLTSAYGFGYGSSSRNITTSYHNRYKNDTAVYNNISIIFDDGQDFDYYKNLYEKENKGHTIFSFRSPYRYTSKLLINELKTIPDIRLNTYGAQYSIDLDDKITNNFQLLYAQINSYVKSHKIYYQDALNMYLGEINTSLRNCLEIEIVELGEITRGQGTIYFKKKDQSEPFEYNVLSSGEKEVVDMLVDIMVKRESFTDSVYLIDEPELHINSSIQRKLLQEINRLIPENCQIWIATHSIGFLRALEEDFVDSSQIIKFNGNYANESITLAPMERNRNNFLELYKTAVDDIATLISPKQIVYCEGKINKDNEGLDEYCYNYIFNRSHPNTLFISSGGCSELNKYSEIALMLINKAFVGANIFKLRDRDINGNSTESNPTTQEDRLNYLKEDPSNRMLKRLEIENYLLDYEIVSKTYPEIEKEKYDVIVSDIINQDLKSKISELMNLCNRKSERGFNKEQFLKSLVPYITEDTVVYKELENEIFNIGI